MSTCISRHGEFGAHELDGDYVCSRCSVLDEDALIAELNRLRQLVRSVESYGIAYEWRRDGHKPVLIDPKEITVFIGAEQSTEVDRLTAELVQAKHSIKAHSEELARRYEETKGLRAELGHYKRVVNGSIPDHLMGRHDKQPGDGCLMCQRAALVDDNTRRDGIIRELRAELAKAQRWERRCIDLGFAVAKFFADGDENKLRGAVAVINTAAEQTVPGTVAEGGGENEIRAAVGEQIAQAIEAHMVELHADMFPDGPHDPISIAIGEAQKQYAALARGRAAHEQRGAADQTGEGK